MFVYVFVCVYEIKKKKSEMRKNGFSVCLRCCCCSSNNMHTQMTD